jgi:hypothetical protein
MCSFLFSTAAETESVQAVLFAYSVFLDAEHKEWLDRVVHSCSFDPSGQDRLYYDIPAVSMTLFQHLPYSLLHWVQVTLPLVKHFTATGFFDLNQQWRKSPASSTSNRIGNISEFTPLKPTSNIAASACSDLSHSVGLIGVGSKVGSNLLRAASQIRLGPFFSPDRPIPVTPPARNTRYIVRRASLGEGLAERWVQLWPCNKTIAEWETHSCEIGQRY